MSAGSEAFRQEWDEVARRVRAENQAVLTDLGMGPETLAYVLKFRGFAKFPHLTTMWVLDPDLRMELGVHCGMHCIGIKLVDDLLDGDQPYPSSDLGMGVYLIQRAICQIGQHANPAAVLECTQRDYAVFWRVQLDEMKRPPENKAEWVACASVKSGLIIANYGEMACLAGDARESIAPSRDFGLAIGNLGMIADDLVDYVKLGQRAGNLGHFIKTGVVSRQEVVDLVEEQRQTAKRSLRAGGPIAHDIDAVVDFYADDILDNYLPAF
jgi:hypothetical protein